MKKPIIAAVVSIAVISLGFFFYNYWKLSQTVKVNNEVINFLFVADKDGIRGFDREVVEVLNKIQMAQKQAAQKK